MNSVIIRLEASTKAFVHGPDRRLEFRIPSLRGILRYWTRAIVGPFHENPQQVSACEASLWGSTKRASRVRIQLADSSLSQKNSYLLPHHPQNGRGPDGPQPASGLDGSLSLRLIGAEKDLRRAVPVFRVALALGGIGQRSRRGAGTFSLRQVEGFQDPALSDLPPKDEKGFAAWIRRVVSHARKSFDLNGSILHGKQDIPPFPMICDHDKCCEIRVKVVDARDEEAARARIMVDLKPFKSPAWGLPYLKTAHKNEFPIKGPGVRWASPVHFRLHAAGAGRWLVVATWMKSRWPYEVPPPRQTWEKVEKFMSAFGGARAWP